MDDKTQESGLRDNVSSDYTQKPGYTWDKGLLLAVADFGSVVAVTSGLITVIQSPLKTITMNLIKTGNFFEHPKPWSYPAIAALYRGSVSTLAGGVARSSYVIGSKNVTKEATRESTARESVIVEKNESKAFETEAKVGQVEERVSLMNQLSSVALVTAGDVAVTQMPETKGQLAKAGIPNSAYKWNTFSNFTTLSKLGVVSRFSGSMINFTALCISTDFYAKYVPGDNETVKQSLGGMLSGFTAAVISFPFAYYRDYLITQVTCSDGKLIAPNAKHMIYDAISHIKNVGINVGIKDAKTIAGAVGIKGLSTGATFAVVAGVSSVLGSDPVSKLVDGAPLENSMKKYKNQLNEIKPSTEEKPIVPENVGYKKP